MTSTFSSYKFPTLSPLSSWYSPEREGSSRSAESISSPFSESSPSSSSSNEGEERSVWPVFAILFAVFLLLLAFANKDKIADWWKSVKEKMGISNSDGNNNDNTKTATVQKDVNVTVTGVDGVPASSSSTQPAQVNVHKETTASVKVNETELNQALQQGGGGSGGSSGGELPVDSYWDSSMSGKQGWCYIGEEMNGDRVCFQVGEKDKCMSGDIYPSRDVCIHPSLKV